MCLCTSAGPRHYFHASVRCTVNQAPVEISSFFKFNLIFFINHCLIWLISNCPHGFAGDHRNPLKWALDNSWFPLSHIL